VDFIRVGSLAEIPEAEMRAFDLPSGKVAVAHIERRVFAFGDECTHMGCSLSETGMFDDHAALVECLCHGSVFDVETGEPTHGPAEDPVPVFAARIVDGWVEVASLPGADG
jgi:3-phenylpropionate/trans-cinnamate dioxygenase ferredoxin component